MLALCPAGDRRILQAKGDVRKPDREVMAPSGHELRHAIEVRSEPSLSSSNARFHFYNRTATMGGGRAFETRAAILARDTAGQEIRDFERGLAIRD